MAVHLHTYIQRRGAIDTLAEVPRQHQKGTSVAISMGTDAVTMYSGLYDGIWFGRHRRSVIPVRNYVDFTLTTMNNHCRCQTTCTNRPFHIDVTESTHLQDTAEVAAAGPNPCFL